MVSNEKEIATVGDKTIKIIGINHGLVLQRFLLIDGWKKEQFMDLTFFCHSSTDSLVQQGMQKKKLRANRSVLAASSPFFAALLPNSELELDVCISIDLTFEEMFCVLQYIYSGKTFCALKIKERILSILKDFGIFVPENVQKQKRCNLQETVAEHHGIIEIAEIRSSNEAVTDNNKVQVIERSRSTPSIDSTFIHMSPSNQTNKPNDTLEPPEKTAIQCEQNRNLLTEKHSKPLKPINKKTQNLLASKYRPLLPKPDLKNCYSPDTTPSQDSRDTSYDVCSSKSPILLLMKPTSSYHETKQIEKTPSANRNENRCLVNVLGNKTKMASNNQEINDLVVQNVTDKESVTLQLPGHISNETNSSNTYSLPAHQETGAYGINSSIEPVCESVEVDDDHNYSLRTNKAQSALVCNPPIPTPHLVSTPQLVYSHLKDVSGLQRNQNIAGLIIKTSDIQNINGCNGIHILLNGNPPSVYPVFPQLIPEQTISLEGEPTSKNGVCEEESIEDKNDLILAQNFLNAEKKRKRFLQKKYLWTNRRFAQLKDIARSILKKAKLQTLNNSTHIAVKRPKVAKKAKKQCNVCGKMVAVLADHLKIHSGIQSHLCDLCGRTFVLRNYLKAHKLRHHTEKERLKTFHCGICDYTTRLKRLLEVHERTHTGERPFDCRYCDKTFREKGTLKRHLRIHTGEKPFACNICGKSYGVRESYLSHFKKKHETNVDNIPRRFRPKTMIRRCEFCQKSFHRLLAYEKHLATHTGETPSVRCAEADCDFTYSEMSQLKDHMAVSHPERTYTCTICSKMFLNKQTLTLHQKTKHDPDFSFDCSYCTARLSSKASLMAHEKIHTRDTPHGCPQCEMRFHSTYMLNLHIRKSHESVQPRKRKRNQKLNTQCKE